MVTSTTNSKGGGRGDGVSGSGSGKMSFQQRMKMSKSRPPRASGFQDRMRMKEQDNGIAAAQSGGSRVAVGSGMRSMPAGMMPPPLAPPRQLNVHFPRPHFKPQVQKAQPSSAEKVTHLSPPSTPHPLLNNSAKNDGNRGHEIEVVKKVELKDNDGVIEKAAVLHLRSAIKGEKLSWITESVVKDVFTFTHENKKIKPLAFTLTPLHDFCFIYFEYDPQLLHVVAKRLVVENTHFNLNRAQVDRSRSFKIKIKDHVLWLELARKQVGMIPDVFLDDRFKQNFLTEMPNKGAVDETKPSDVRKTKPESTNIETHAAIVTLREEDKDLWLVLEEAKKARTDFDIMIKDSNSLKTLSDSQTTFNVASTSNATEHNKPENILNSVAGSNEPITTTGIGEKFTNGVDSSTKVSMSKPTSRNYIKPTGNPNDLLSAGPVQQQRKDLRMQVSSESKEHVDKTSVGIQTEADVGRLRRDKMDDEFQKVFVKQHKEKDESYEHKGNNKVRSNSKMSDTPVHPAKLNYKPAFPLSNQNGVLNLTTLQNLHLQQELHNLKMKTLITKQAAFVIPQMAFQEQLDQGLKAIGQQQNPAHQFAQDVERKEFASEESVEMGVDNEDRNIQKVDSVKSIEPFNWADDAEELNPIPELTSKVLSNNMSFQQALQAVGRKPHESASKDHTEIKPSNIGQVKQFNRNNSGAGNAKSWSKITSDLSKKGLDVKHSDSWRDKIKDSKPKMTSLNSNWRTRPKDSKTAFTSRNSVFSDSFKRK